MGVQVENYGKALLFFSSSSPLYTQNCHLPGITRESTPHPIGPQQFPKVQPLQFCSLLSSDLPSELHWSLTNTMKTEKKVLLVLRSLLCKRRKVI